MYKIVGDFDTRREVKGIGGVVAIKTLEVVAEEETPEDAYNTLMDYLYNDKDHEYYIVEE